MKQVDHALLGADGTVLQVIVIDEDDPASVAVLDTVVKAKDGPHKDVKKFERIDPLAKGEDVPNVGRKKRQDGKWRRDDEHEIVMNPKRREHRDGDEHGKPTGALLDTEGKPKKGTELPEVSGKKTP